MKDRNKRQKFTLISILLLLLLSYPLISVANRVAFWLGIPALFLYIFIVWAFGIVLLLLTAESGGGPTNKHE